MAWEKNEEQCGNLGEEVAVAEQVKRDGVKGQDEDVKSSGSLRDKNTKMNPAAKAPPRSSFLL